MNNSNDHFRRNIGLIAFAIAVIIGILLTSGPFSELSAYNGYGIGPNGEIIFTSANRVSASVLPSGTLANPTKIVAGSTIDVSMMFECQSLYNVSSVTFTDTSGVVHNMQYAGDLGADGAVGYQFYYIYEWTPAVVVSAPTAIHFSAICGSQVQLVTSYVEVLRNGTGE